MPKRLAVIALTFCLIFTLCATPSVCRAELVPPGPFEMVANTAVPAIYNELVGAYVEAAKNNPDAAIKQFSEKLDFVNKTLGRTMAVLDVGGKLYAGDTKEAAISAGLTVLGELAGTQTGGAYLSAVGLSTAPVTTLIASIQIYRASEAELQKSNIAVSLESLYGSIEADPVLKNRNRALGAGDPIPVTSESVEYLWRKILLNNNWRNLFKVYVTDQLGQEWPEVSVWQNWSAPGNSIEDAALQQNKDAYKSYIAGLLSSLNTLAKNREYRVLASKQLKTLQQRFKSLSIETLLTRYSQAIKDLPKVHYFAKQCPELIQEGLQERQLGPLNIVISSSQNYAKRVLPYIPDGGSLGTERSQLLTDLKNYYHKAWEAREFVQNRLDAEDRKRAEEASVSNWRAKSVGFPLTYDNLQSRARTEYYQTGAIVETRQQLDDAWSSVTQDYRQQGDTVYEEYQRVKEEDNSAESDLKAFNQQLDSYFNIDNRQYSESADRLSALLFSLQEQDQLRNEKIADQRKLFLTELNNLQDLPNQFESLLKNYHLENQPPPPSNYVGLVNLQLPSHTLPGPEADVASFTRPHFDDLNRLRHQTEQALFLTVANDRQYPLSTMIQVMEALRSSAEEMIAQKEAFEKFRKNVNEQKHELANNPGPPSSSVNLFQNSLVTRINPFLEKFQALFARAESLQSHIPTVLRNYQTDLENIEKDLDTLTQLGGVLKHFSPTLKEFVHRYQMSRAAYPMSRDTILLHPLRGAVGTKATCDQFNKTSVLMRSADIVQAKRDLKQLLAERSLLWLEQKYAIKINTFAENYFIHRARLDRIITPEHYSFLPGVNGCDLVYPEYFDGVSNKISEIKEINGRFPLDLEVALSVNRGSAFDNLALLAIPSRDKTPDNQSVIDLDNLPDGPPTILAHLIQTTWDDKTRSSAQKLIDTFHQKLADYRKWQSKEDYFVEVRNRCGEIASPLEGYEFEARSLYDKGDMDKALPAYERALKLQQPIMNCYSSASADTKLSKNRQDYMANSVTRYEQQFYYIAEMVRNLKLQQKGRQAGAQYEQQVKKINQLYERFEDAYESKNESAVMSLISDNWSAADGATLFDLEDNLHNMYNVFDDIQYQISGLSIEETEAHTFNVTYKVNITGVIYDNDLTHEEVSLVTEQVTVDSDGQARITKTLAGNYWSIQ